MPGKGFIRLEKRLSADRSPFAIEGACLASLLEWEPRAGEAFTVCSGDGTLFRASLSSLDAKRAILEPYEEVGKLEESPAIILIQALPERQRFELIIQKATELGVSSIIPFRSERSTTLEDLDSKQKRSHNWPLIALKAARQSRRWDIPEILPCASFKEALASVADADLKIILWEGPGLRPLKEELTKAARTVKAALLVGPEGGFTEEEVRMAEKSGFTPVTLGKRILRTETAAILGVGLLRYELGG